MLSNAYTKKEILESLTSKGYFIDSFTLDSFFEKWQIEAIFENEEGQEFYDKSTLDFVCEKLFKGDNTPIQPRPEVSSVQSIQMTPPPQPNMQPMQPQIMPQQYPNSSANIQYAAPQFQNNMPYQPNMQYQNLQMQPQPYMQYNSYPNTPYQNMPMQPQSQPNNMWAEGAAPKPNLADEFSINDAQTSNILKSIKLSDGDSLMNRLKTETGLQDFSKNSASNELSDDEILRPLEKEKPASSGILSGAMEAAGMTEEDLMQSNQDSAAPADTPDFDDISLLSESMEAQEKFREYVVSELSKKNVDLTPQGNEFKLDISERTINMIARTVAKKIAKNVMTILTSDKNGLQSGPLKQENEKLVKKTKELESENKKLRLLLTESNKNLSSYKEVFFGFYRKVSPKQNNKKEKPKK